MDDELGELNLPVFQMPDNIEIPVKHDQPKTTLESLNQIRNEFNTKLQEAKEKNDPSKKRRYERQLKQFEDAIKATKDGKQYDYSQLVVPPGFAPIPLQNGRPILNDASFSNRISQQTTRPSSTISNNKTSPQSQQKLVEPNGKNDFEEASDDLLEQLENEIDENDLDDDENDEGFDPEDEKIKKHLNSIMPNIRKLVPNEHLIDDFEKQAAAFKIPESNVQQRQSKQISTTRESFSPPQTAQKDITKQSLPTQSNQAAQKPKIINKELNILLERQRLFREAALKAKQEGNVNVALVYLRHAKGFDSMIVAAENGLPLDMSNLPVPPQLVDKQASSTVSSTNVKKVASTNETSLVLNEEPISGDRKAVFKRLQDDLLQQIKIATANYKHFTNMGDINNANKFNKIARESIQDLDALKSAFSHGEPVPLYHYEKRSYQTIDCNSDLTDNDLELTIVRAINLPLPKDFETKHMNTYVKFEFPYPPEESQTDKTNKQSGTLNPGDKILASCNVKLQPLENTSTIHDAFDIFEGRRQLGGKLEIKIRIREPLLHKEIKTLEQRWLIIDKFNVDSTKSVNL